MRYWTSWLFRGVVLVVGAGVGAVGAGAEAGAERGADAAVNIVSMDNA